MKISKVYSGIVSGIDYIPLCIETCILRGFPEFKIVGQSQRLKPSFTEKIRTSIISGGYKFPRGRVVVSIDNSPSPSVPTELDLAIITGILIATDQVSVPKFDQNKLHFLGEVALNGDVRTTKTTYAAFKRHLFINKEKLFLIHNASNRETIHIKDTKNTQRVPHIKNLDVIKLEFSTKQQKTKKYVHIRQKTCSPKKDLYISHSIARAVQAAALANLNTLLIGPPGYGKNEITKVLFHLKKRISYKSLLNQIILDLPSPTFREPIQSCSKAAFLGNNTNFTPGEVTLAEGGILALHELPEFKKELLQDLKNILDQKKVSLKNRSNSLIYPAKFQLVATMNPCKCGYRHSLIKSKTCTCSEKEVKKYLNKISGGLLDRFAVVLYIDKADKTSSVSFEELTRKANQTSRKKLQITNSNKRILKKIQRDFSLSHRKINFVEKIATALAEIDSSPQIKEKHLYEAAHYSDDRELRRLMSDERLPL